MKYEINVADQHISVDIPKNPVEVVKAEDLPELDQNRVISNSLVNPLDSPDLATFLNEKKNILIIVNDAARNTPTDLTIQAIYDEIKNKNVKFLVAVGTHREPTESEYYRIFGKFYDEFKDRIFCHDSISDKMTFLGTTTRGTPVNINSEVVNADGVIIISSVEPHYFAGFTGGRKSFLPGIAAFSSIEKNHSLALLEDAKICRLEGNPVHEDMKEAADLVPTPAFCMLTVLDSFDKVVYASSGNIHSALSAASQKVMEVFSPEVQEKAEIVIAINHPPLNRNLYQAQKGLENCKNILKKDGIFILVSQCSEGIGNSAFYELLSSCQTPEEVFNKIEANYKLGFHKAAKFVSFMRNHKLWLVSELADDKLEKIFINNFASVQEAVNKAIMHKGTDAKVNLIHNAGIIAPRIAK